MTGTKIDLHGFTIHEAWRYFRQVTKDSYFANHKSIIVITGHGAMSKEIQAWCDVDPYVTEIKRLDPNTGAWKVSIKKNQSVKTREETPVDLTGLYKKWNKK